jgi:hypothetical protein
MEDAMSIADDPHDTARVSVAVAIQPNGRVAVLLVCPVCGTDEFEMSFSHLAMVQAVLTSVMAEQGVEPLGPPGVATPKADVH